MRVLLVLACLSALGACDKVFGLSAPLADAPVDAACERTFDDEDGDCYPDEADNCPGIAASQADADEDTVGDACDPDSERSSDHLFAFESFADPAAAMQAWHDPTATERWTFGPGSASHTDTGDTRALLQRTLPVDAEDMTVEVGFTFSGWQATAQPGTRIGVYIDGDLDVFQPPTGHGCYIKPSSSTVTKAYLDEAGVGTRGQLDVATPANLGEMRIVFRRRLSPVEDLTCDVQIPAGTATRFAPAPRTATSWPTGRYIGIDGAYASVTLRYVAIYVSP